MSAPHPRTVLIAFAVACLYAAAAVGLIAWLGTQPLMPPDDPAEQPALTAPITDQGATR